MSQDPTLAVWALVIAVLGLAATLLFRSPKELHGQLEKRVDEIEDNHNGLAKLVARLEAIVERLERSVADLNRQRSNARNQR